MTIADLGPQAPKEDSFKMHWLAGGRWDTAPLCSSRVTLDDATSEHYSMFFVEEEGTASSFRGMGEVIEGLPSSLYTDRGSHYWHTIDGSSSFRRRPPPPARAPGPQ